MCVDFTETIYFEGGGDTITRQAESLINAAAARARGCEVTGVDILGLADAPGDAAGNLALSRRRGDAVRVALHRRGFNKVEIKVTAGGQIGAQTQGGQDSPLHRRANVEFHLINPPAAKR